MVYDLRGINEPLLSTTSSWQNVQLKKKRQQEGALDRWRMTWGSKEMPELTTNWKLKAGSRLNITSLLTSTLSPREQEIVRMDATALLERLHHPHLDSPHRYTAVEVTMAVCKVSTVAHALTNSLTEIFFCDAMMRATELDKYRRDHNGGIVGPLHGLPVSVKDHIFMKGLDTSTGYIAWANKSIADEDATVVDVLRKAGAVLYVKTANPQTLLSLETDNNVYGRTLNPFNLTLTPGGSSGGESALVASHGSFLGIGTDIGGSIRVPAGYMGLYGFKASVARMPHAGLNGSHDGMDAIIGVLGPIARSARDLSLFCRTMLQYEPWLVEPSLIEIPWKQDLADGAGLPNRLSIAILWDDGVVMPHEPIFNALKKAKEALIAAGHEVISWEPVDHQASWDLISKLYFLDGGEEYRQTMACEPMVEQTRWILSQAPNNGKPFTMAEFFKLSSAREKFRTRIAHYWNKTVTETSTGRPVDVVLCPVAATLAPPHDSTRWWGYTSYWNLVDYPSVVFPAGQHRASTFKSSPDYPRHTPRNPTEEYIMAQWDPEVYDNAHVGLQLVGRRLNEEKLLGMLKVVEAALGAYESGHERKSKYANFER